MRGTNRHNGTLALAIGALALVAIAAAVMLWWTQNLRSTVVPAAMTKTAGVTSTAKGTPAAQPSVPTAADPAAQENLIRSADGLAALTDEIGQVKISATLLALSGLQGPVDDLQAGRKRLQSDLEALGTALQHPVSAADQDMMAAAQEMDRYATVMQTQMDVLQQAKKDRDLAAVESGLNALTTALRDADEHVTKAIALLK